MYTQVEKPKKSKSKAVTNSVAQKKCNAGQDLVFADNRSDLVLHPQLQRTINSNPQLQKLSPIQAMGEKRYLSSNTQLPIVTQMVKKTVAGVEVDVGGGYTNWDGWHINWKLGGKKGGFEQYHLTSQDRLQHYFFIIDGDELKDTKPKADLVPKKGIKGGISKAPKDVQDFVRQNFRQLMG